MANRTSSLFATPLLCRKMRGRQVTVGGNQYVTAPVGSGSQAGGRIVFTGVPAATDPISISTVGITSITYERQGGTNGFVFGMGFSERVVGDPGN